jgi:adenosine deaminase
LNNTTIPADLPKAEIHLHLEGAAPPDLVRRMAERNGVELPEALFTDDGTFRWTDFPDFLNTYDMASSSMRKAVDYRDVTYEYLRDCAAQGAIYVEVFSSPDHAATMGMSYGDHLTGMVDGIDDAFRDFGIVGRIIVTCVRHLGPERAVDVARATVAELHPHVVGFGMGGNEMDYTQADFRPAFDMAAAAGLPCTTHAGEVDGAQSVRDALDHLPVTRIGHGVRAIEDPALVAEIADKGIVLECCPISNFSTGVYKGYEDHPLPQLIEAGCKVTLNSDDPPYFATTIGHEYEEAARGFGFSTVQLLNITRAAINGGFVDDVTKQTLLARVDDWEARN